MNAQYKAGHRVDDPSTHATDAHDDRVPHEVDGSLDHFHASYRDADYYSTGRTWSDYAPAYRYGREAFEQHRDERFEQLESVLAHNWDQAKPPSRLVWAEARGAVHAAWQHARASWPHASRADAFDEMS